MDGALQSAYVEIRGQRELRKEGWSQKAQNTHERYKAEFAKENADVKVRPGSKDTNAPCKPDKKSRIV